MIGVEVKPNCRLWFDQPRFELENKKVKKPYETCQKKKGQGKYIGAHETSSPRQEDTSSCLQPRTCTKKAYKGGSHTKLKKELKTFCEWSDRAAHTRLQGETTLKSCNCVCTGPGKLKICLAFARLVRLECAINTSGPRLSEPGPIGNVFDLF